MKKIGRRLGKINYKHIFLLPLSLMGLFITVVAVRQNTNLKTKAAFDQRYVYPNLNYGKGLIYYTENYLRNFTGTDPVTGIPYSKFNLPAPDTQIPALTQSYIQAQDCSRYLDLTYREIDYLKDLGVNFVILGFGPAAWYNLEPSRGVYNFAKLDEWVIKLNSAGIRPVIQLWGTPTWSSGASSPRGVGQDFVTGCLQNNTYIGEKNEFSPYNKPPNSVTDFSDFAKTLATHYNGNSNNLLKVTDFSLGNEPNISSFWSGSWSQFVSMHNSGYQAIKSVRPDAVVWGVNLLGNCCDADRFVNENLDALDFDVLAIHTYPADFNFPPDTVNSTSYSMGNFENIFAKLDTISKHMGKSIVITEMGYRSHIERTVLGDTTSKVNIDLNTKSIYLKQSLDRVNNVNSKGINTNRVLGVANNVLYTPWRWWSTGLVNMYNSASGQTDFLSKEPAYYIFKNFKLAFNTVPISGIDGAYYDSSGGYTIINGSEYWYRSANNLPWVKNSLQSAFCNINCSGVPISDLDSAYFDKDGNYTIIKGDKYWYKALKATSWYSNTLTSAWYPNTNAATLGVPTSGVSAVYYDTMGNQTVIKGDKYWYRKGNVWSSETLRAAYYRNSDGEAKGVPIIDIDAAYFDKFGNYTVIKGDRYWYKALGSTTWYSNTLKSAYYY